MENGIGWENLVGVFMLCRSCGARYVTQKGQLLIMTVSRADCIGQCLGVELDLVLSAHNESLVRQFHGSAAFLTGPSYNPHMLTSLVHNLNRS